LNVTDRAIVTAEMVNYIDYKGKAPLIKPLLDYYFNFYKNNKKKSTGSHSILTITIFDFMSVMTGEEFK
jgi:purine nucleosidase